MEDARSIRRRDVLKTLLRAGALAGLAGVTFGALAGRRDPCARPASACARCAQRPRCDRPQAVAGRAGGGVP